jgi:uncharacterized protein (TIGR02186 family)
VIKRLFVIAFLLAGAAQAWAADENPHLIAAVEPAGIDIDAAYNGARVTVTGSVPADAEAFIRVVGPTETYKLKQKGRVMGLWMNTGSVEIANVPGLFLLYRSQGGGAVPADLGLRSIHQAAQVVAQDQDKQALLDEFFKLKGQVGLYGETNNAIQYGALAGATKSFTAALTLPAALPQGSFTLEVFAIRDGAVIALQTRGIEAREVGLPAWISNLAFQHGAMYGILAVLVAVMAGWATGVMFKASKGAH